MRKRFISAEITLLCLVIIAGSVAAQTNRLKVFSTNLSTLEKVKASNPEKNKDLKTAYKKLLRDADKAMNQGPWSVMDKAQAPSSGDKHDYLSLARYYWPDPKKPDGLPYIQRDGETNPEIESISDSKYFDDLAKNVYTLGLAYYFSGEEKYAEKWASLIRTWFLDPKTKMNPHLNFGQVVKGKEGGRSSGLIEMRGLYRVVDGIGFLEGSKAWTAEDQKGMKEWFEKYLQWLAESEIGKKEAKAANNHGTWLNVQKAAINLFLDRRDSAAAILRNNGLKLIASQIQPDGQQPEELDRTRSLHYTLFNLEALFTLASIGDQAGVDLWGFKTDDGRSIHKAVEYTLPYITNEKKWEHEQLDEVKPERYFALLRQAAFQWKEEQFAKAAEKVAEDGAEKDRINLLFPTE